MKKSKNYLRKMLSRLCCPPTPLMGLSYREKSLCRVPPSPVHPHEGAPMRSCCNPFIFDAKSLDLLPCGSISFTLTRRSLVLVPSLFQSVLCCGKFTFLCSNSASVLSSCYSWYLLIWNCLQLEFSDNDRFKAGVHVKAVLTSLNTAFLPISRSRFKQH